MIKTLGEVCDITMGQAPVGTSYNDRSEGVPLIAGAGDFDGGRLVPKKYTTKPTKLARAGDIVLSIRASIGAKVWSDGTYCLGRGVAGLRPGPGVDPAFLWHWLTHAERKIAEKGRGATFLQVSRSDIAEMPIDLPAEPEQRRISAILDEADALCLRRLRVLGHLDELAVAVFHHVFGDPVTNDHGLPRASIGSVADVMTGNSPSRGEPGNFGRDIEWIKSDNLGGDVATVAEEWLSSRGRRVARVAPAGSVLVTCIAGSQRSIGKASLVDRCVAFNQQINAVLPSPGIDAAFLLVQLKAAPVLVREKSTGGMTGLVSKSAFKSVQILLPPLARQHEFASRVARIDAQRSAVRRALAASETLLASLGRRAFEGEL